ncbi:MAG: Dna2/Cas4 domain-containing protein, partial [Candidatus Thorarchaeota archaeon]
MITNKDFLRGHHCFRAFWLSVNNKLRNQTVVEQCYASQNQEFVKIVQNLFPDSINLSNISPVEKLISESQQKLLERKILFNSGFLFKDLFSQIDIIEPNTSSWNIYKIKASSRVKERYIVDLIYQKFILEHLGLKIDKFYVVYINNKFIRSGPIDPNLLIVKKDVTDHVLKEFDIEPLISKLRDIKSLDSLPSIDFSRNCHSPTNCLNKELCWQNIPENSIFQLSNYKKVWEWFQEG